MTAHRTLVADASAGDLITVLVDSAALAGLAAVAVVVALCAIAHHYRPLRFGWWRIATGGTALVIAAITQLPPRSLSDISTIDVHPSLGNALSWPLDGIDLRSTFASSGWWLNIVLFVPFGFALRGLLQSRPPLRSIALVALTAAAVESGQAFTGLRAADLADFAMNFVGGIVGCLLFAASRPLAERLTRRSQAAGALRGALVAALSATVLAAMAALTLVHSADAAQQDLADELRSQYGATNLRTMADVFYPSGDDESAFDRFMSATSVRPDSILRDSDRRTVQVRYTDEYFGLSRCVFVTWSSDGVEFRRDSGDQCTVFLGS